MKLSEIAVLVTGGVQGIGRAIAEALLAKQAKVCIADVREAEGKRAAEELASQYGAENVLFMRCDVTSDEDFETALTTAKTKFGHLDVLVNNAGITDVDLKDWSKVIDINLKGVMRGTVLAYNHLEDRHGKKGGMVINMGSITGLRSTPLGSSYCAAKFGIVGWSRSMGHRWNANETGVKVNVICPKAVETDMMNAATQFRAFNEEMAAYLKHVESTERIKPSKIADAVFQLLEEEVTGSVLVVDYDKTFYHVGDGEKL